MRKISLVGHALVMGLVGCSAIVVSDGTNELKGIPFYVKVPVATQDTLWAESEMLVQLKVSEQEPGDVGKILRSISAPAGGPTRLRDTPDDRAALNAAIDALPSGDSVDFAAAVKSVGTLIGEMSLKRGSSPVSPDNCGARAANVALVSNAWSLSMVADPKPYYIVTKQPVFGTSTANFKFANDGTMTESNVSVTDETAKTLLALFPITAKLTKQWGLGDTGAAKAPETYTKGPLKGKPVPPKPATVIKIDASVTFTKTVYALRTARHFEGPTTLNAYLTPKANPVPLSLCDAFGGTGGVQLVSVTSQGEQGGGDKDASKDWQIRGTVTPPKADAAASAGSR